MEKATIVRAVFSGLDAMRSPRDLARRLRVPRWMVRRIGSIWARGGTEEHAVMDLDACEVLRRLGSRTRQLWP